MIKSSWDEIKKKLAVGSVVTGLVTKHEVYGIYLDLGYGFDAVVPRTEFKDDGTMTEEEYPHVGSEVKAKVLGFRDHGEQIWMSVKPSELKG